ncbi:MAG TPA: aminoglycoside phosphotransferase [Thiotrichales bacterium]|nr:aminoglycoside phosphotransferase [Thiotrichales bacterium]
MDRLTQLQQWLESVAENTYTDIQPASADASFRQYFRVLNRKQNRHYIVMDAPPDKEDCHPFIHVTELLRGVGVNAPEIFARDVSQGFLLLADLGNRPYLDELNQESAGALYSDAIDALIKMQTIEAILPAYDKTLLQNEMALFETWYLKRHLNISLTPLQKEQLASVFALLISNAEEQPQVFVHRDYHSRNLMITDNNNPGVIDYQDAVNGPITYDLVSLFKDCYIEWPREKVEQWLAIYLSRLSITYSITTETLIRWFDLMGVQRHLKVLGIFARLNYRDGKAQYLDDLPLTLKYVVETCERYPELAPLKQLLDETVLSAPA